MEADIMVNSPSIFVDGPQPDIEDYLCKFVVNLGMRGSGKSNTGKVLCSGLRNLGISLSIIDKDGEFWGLKQEQEYLVVGGKHADVELHPEHAAILARTALERNVSIIIDLSVNNVEECDVFLLNYLQEIWSIEQSIRRPHTIVIDEAQEFIPQGVSSELKEIITRLALRGRKWGIGAVIISQRSSRVDKDVITQAEIFFLHRIKHPADFGVFCELTGLKRKEISDIFPMFKDGEVYYIGPTSAPERRKVCKQRGYDVGYTPKMGEHIDPPNLRQLSDELLEMFRAITIKVNKEESKIERLQHKIDLKEAENAELQKRVNDLEMEIDIATRLKVELALPTQQLIEQAIIQRLETTGSPTAQIVQSQSLEQHGNGDAAKQELPPIQKPYLRAYNRVRKIVDNANSIHLRVLAFLEARSPNKYTLKQVAAWINLSESTLASRPPIPLVDVGMIARSRGERNEFVYQSNLKRFLEDHFENYRPTMTDRELNLVHDVLVEHVESIVSEDSGA